MVGFLGYTNNTFDFAPDLCYLVTDIFPFQVVHCTSLVIRFLMEVPSGVIFFLYPILQHGVGGSSITILLALEFTGGLIKRPAAITL